MAENYNPDANLDDGSCIILQINDAYIRFGNFNDKDSLLEVFIKTGIASSRIFEIELLTRGFVISELIDGLVTYENNKGLHNNHIWLFSNSGFNANYGEELLFSAKVEPMSNKFCIDEVRISEYNVINDDCLKNLNVDISFPASSFQSDPLSLNSLNSIYFMGIDYKEKMLRMGINLLLTNLTIPLETFYTLKLDFTITNNKGEKLKKDESNIFYSLGNFDDYLDLNPIYARKVFEDTNIEIKEHQKRINININNYVSGYTICIDLAEIYSYGKHGYDLIQGDYTEQEKIILSLGPCIELQ